MMCSAGSAQYRRWLLMDDDDDVGDDVLVPALDCGIVNVGNKK